MTGRTFFYPERCRVDQDIIQQETGRHDALFMRQFMDSRFTMIIFVLIQKLPLIKEIISNGKNYLDAHR